MGMGYPSHWYQVPSEGEGYGTQSLVPGPFWGYPVSSLRSLPGGILESLVPGPFWYPKSGQGIPVPPGQDRSAPPDSVGVLFPTPHPSQRQDGRASAATPRAVNRSCSHTGGHSCFINIGGFKETSTIMPETVVHYSGLGYLLCLIDVYCPNLRTYYTQ